MTRRLTFRRMHSRTLLAWMLAMLALFVGGAAYAYWTGSGSGAGSGTTGSTVAATLSPGAPTANLYPGGTANVVLSVSNPNASPVRIGSLARDTSQGAGTGFAVDTGHSGCGLGPLSFTTQTNGGAGWTVPGKVGAVDGTLSITLTSSLAMDVGAADACQGASFTVYLAAGP
jgi:hypothetical protein